MKLFLSYNSLDKHFVKTIRDKLVAAGFSDQMEIFFDSDSLLAGDDWAKRIGGALRNSDAFLCFISENGIGKWQEKEAVTATSASTKSKTGYKIIPVIIANQKGEINRDLPWFMINYQWVEFADATDDYAFQKLVTGLRTSSTSEKAVNEKNPYKGLNVFETTDAPYFFGRTADINWVFYKKLKLHSKNYASNFLAIVADSGVGKSSFVRAGLISALQNGRYEGSAGWKYITINPGKNPINELSTALQREKVIDSFSTFEKEIRSDESGNYLNSVAKVYGQKIVLFIDQFEEVVTQCKDEEERKRFLLNLTKATESGKMLILLTLRSDYYASFAEYIGFKDKLESSNYTLAAIDVERQRSDNAVQLLRDIIQKPALLHGVRFEEGLVDRLIEDTIPLNGALPLLQLTLFKLWNPDTIADGTVTLSEYNTVSNAKGIEGIIETHADNVYERLCPDGPKSEKSDLFRDLLLQLVELSESHEDVRRTVEKQKLISDLKAYNEDEIKSMINELAGEENRLLKVSVKEGGISYVDIVHEVLIRKWNKLRAWINENRKALKEKETLEAAAAAFTENKTEFYRGRKLREAVKWQQSHKNLSTKAIDDFIQQSKKKVLQFWLVVFGFAVISVILFFLVKPVYEQWQFKNECKESQLYKNALKQYHTDSIEKVKRLNLSGNNLNDQLKFCNCFPALDSVELTGTFDVRNLSSIKALQQVKYLSLTKNDSLSDYSTIGTLKELKNLTKLDLSRNNLTDIGALKELKNLTTLYLHGIPNPPGLIGYTELKKNPNLKIVK